MVSRKAFGACGANIVHRSIVILAEFRQNVIDIETTSLRLTFGREVVAVYSQRASAF